MATVKPASDFVPKREADKLAKAMKGFGTDEATIIAVLSQHSNKQLVEIAHEYKTRHGKDLDHMLKKELSGDFEKLAVALVTPHFKYLAEEVHDAMSGIGTNEATLIEILVPMTNAEMKNLVETYEKRYETLMGKELKGELSGSFLKLLQQIQYGGRDEHLEVDEEKAKEEAQALYKAGEKAFGTDDSLFIKTFVSRSFPQLKAIFHNYKLQTGHSMQEAIEKEMKGDLKSAFLTIVNCVENPAKFYAKRLNESMSGLGTKERILTRVIVTRCEKDMKVIKAEFLKEYNKKLDDVIASETSGDYKKLLLALIKE